MKSFSDFGIEIPHQAAGNVKTKCPECSGTRKHHRDPCLSVNVDEGVWNCHHCGWGGSLREKVERSPYRRPTLNPSKEAPDEITQFFRERGISSETVTRNRITAANVWMPQPGKEEPAIAFPYFRGGELINVKYRGRGKSFRMEKDAELILYGLDDMADTVIVVEGEMDKLAVEEAGFTSCVSVPNGAPPADAKNYTAKLDYLASADFSEVEVFILALDNDEPGQRLEQELSRRLGRERCKRVSWPEDCKDANDVLLNHGAEELATRINGATFYPISGVFDAVTYEPDVMALYESGFKRGLSTGWGAVDEYYTVRAGQFSVITGIPNHGKSNWLDDLCVNLANRHGWNVAFFTPENQPYHRHLATIAEKYSGKPFSAGPTPRMTRDELDDALAWVNAHFRWLLPEEDEAGAWTIDGILALARACVLRHGINGLVIDPWNEIEHSRPAGLTETEYVSQALSKIRRFARQNDVHVWIVAHPTKLLREKDGKYPVPTPYDISGSAHWRNKADNCLTIWRDLSDPDSLVTEVHVSKVRFREIGKVGHCELRFNPVTHSYSDFSQKFDPQFVSTA